MGARARRREWQVLAAAVAGAAVSPATLVNVPFSLFITTFESVYSWSRPAITAALSVFLLLLIVCLPLAGWLVDRFGARRVALPSVLGYGVALASTGAWVSSPRELCIHYGIIAVLSAGAQSLTFIRVLSTWFDRRRGLAIGACMAGFGIGYVCVPLLTQWLLAGWGWRGAYAGLGALAVLGAWPLIALFLHDAPGVATPGVATPGVATPAPPAYACAAALRSRELWLLAAIFALASAALNGVQAQLAPMMTERGRSAGEAAWLLSTVGIGSFPARLLIGYWLDKVFAPYLAIGFFGASAVALYWLADGQAPIGLALAAMAVGASLGAENDVLGYLTGRYFDLNCFGKIYGALLSAYLLGAAAGPYWMAQTHARSGSYAPALHAGAAAILLACTLLAFLRRYRLGDPSDAHTH